MRDRADPVNASLRAFFEPTGIAVIGASADPARVGGRVLMGLETNGYSGAIHPVHPKETEIGGRPCHTSVRNVPDPVDMAIICLAAARVPEAIRDCGARGIKAAVVFADGFDQAGAEDLHAALADARAASGLRMIGPNTVGIRTTGTGAFATFAADLGTPLRVGSVATVAQSGGLAVYFGSAQLMTRGYGASHVFDTGGEFDVTAADCVDYLATTEVSAISLVLEGSRDGDALRRAVRRATEAGKPVVFLKIGRSVKGEAQIASHTGTLAGATAIFEAALRAAGAIIAEDERDLMDMMVLAAANAVPKGRRVGIVTPSGGFGILALDAAEAAGLEVPEPALRPSAAERAELAHGDYGNPLDFSSTISAGPMALEFSLSWMARQPNIDAVILWQAYGAVRADRQALIRAAIAGARDASDTPIFVCGLTSPDFQAELRTSGVLWFEEPTRLIRSLGLAAPPAESALPAEKAHPAPSAMLSAAAARDRLAGLSAIPHAPLRRVASAAEAAAALAELGGKGVMKVEAPGIPHKSELGFVSGVIDTAGAAEAFAALDAARQEAGLPDAPLEIQGFESGFEIALGAFRDPTFGPSVMVAIGGIFLEILKDTAFGVAPVGLDEAHRMIDRLKGAAILKGARGQPVADIPALARAVVALSEFIAGAPEIEQIDINPVMVRPKGEGLVAVDAAIFLKEETEI